MRKLFVMTIIALASSFAAQQAVAKTPSKTSMSKHHKKHMKKSAAAPVAHINQAA
jgi:hypothetical protein